MKIAERVLQLLLHDKTAQQIIGCQSRAIGSDPFTASSQKQEAHGSFFDNCSFMEHEKNKFE